MFLLVNFALIEIKLNSLTIQFRSVDELHLTNASILTLADAIR
jgi:hypothetical protein